MGKVSKSLTAVSKTSNSKSVRNLNSTTMATRKFRCAPEVRDSVKCNNTNISIKENIKKNRTVYKKSNCALLVSVQLVLLVIVLQYFVDFAESQETGGRTRQNKAMQFRDSRKLFGGYRITPKFCEPSRPSRRHDKSGSNQKTGPAICMFNHECIQRDGEVVGTCMEGFLFGACCQLFGIPTLKKDSVEAGVVMMEGDQQMMYPDSLTPDRMHIISHEDNLFTYNESEKPTEKNTAATLKEAMTSLEYTDDFTKNPDDELNEKIIEISNHFIKNPSTLAVSMSALPSTEKYIDLTSSGVAQITNSLLQSGPDIITVDAGGNSDTGLFSHSTISHEEADTILVDKNGTEINDVSRPSEFSGPGANIYVSTMQSKPAMNAMHDSSTTPANSYGMYGGADGIEEKQSTTDLMTSIPTKYYTKFSTKPQEHITDKPTYQKPGFRPKPTKIPAKENFVLVQTVTRPQNPLKNSVTSAEVNQELASVESIITMLNGSFSMNQNPNKHVTTEMPHTSYPSKYSSSYPTYFDPSYETTTFKYPTGGHFITSSANKQTTSKPNSNHLTKLPSFGSDAYPNKYGSSNGYFTRKPVLRNVTKQPEDITNNLVSSTLSYDEYWGSPSTAVDRKPPSTSYVFSPVPTKRPESNIHNVVPIHEATIGNLDNFASVTPTVIVLSDLNSQYDHTPDPNKFFIKSPVKPVVDELPPPVLVNRISEIEPVIKKPATTKPEVTTSRPKKPAHAITINNIVTSTNVINFGDTNDQNIGGRPGDDKRPQVQSGNEDTNEVEKEDDTDKKDEKDKEENEKVEAEMVDSETVEADKIGEGDKVEGVEIVQTDKVEADKLGDDEKVEEEVAVVVSNVLPKQKTTTEKTVESTILITPKPSYSTGNSKPGRPGATPTKKPTKKKSTTTSAPLTNPTTPPIYVQTSSDDLINFPPVRNPNLNSTGTVPGIFTGSNTTSFIDPILQEVEFTTPALMLQEDDELNEKMSLFVNKIVGSLQGTFQELHDIVILDKTPNTTITNQNNKTPTTKKPATKKPTKKPTRIATTTVSTTTPTTTTTKKPARVTTKKPTTVVVTQAATTKKPPTRLSSTTSTTTKKPKPTKSKTTAAPITTITTTEAPIVEESFTTETPNGDFKHLCGVRPMIKSGRIVGGKGAVFGEWPWQVLVRESTWLGLFTKNKCGGVLITSKYVTTAAHCQPGFLASLVAVMGEYDISGDLETKRAVTKNVRRVIVHRQYDAATFENDLALLELESPVIFDSHIVPICMPSNEADFTGRMATVTGWGRLKYGGGVPSVLQEVHVPVIENSVCQEMFQTAGHSKIILHSFLCAGYANGQKDSCEGDSGGPLVLQRADGRWELAGTVSHGIKCAAPYLPGVYMRTTFYKPWLKSITGVN